jgi:hypothetical protein
MDNAVLKVNDLGLKGELDKLFTKVKNLVEKYNGAKEENLLLKEKVKDLERNISDFKLDITNKGSELLNKDKEITDLKNRLLDEKKNKISSEDKAQLKSRIRELMVRLDAHLEQKSNNNF